MYEELSTLIFMIGVLMAAMAVLRFLLGRAHIEPIIGYVLLGLAISLFNGRYRVLPLGTSDILEFLSDLGIIVLLFDTGLKSNLKSLMTQAKRASVLAAVNVIFSGGIGFFVSHYLLRVALIPSLLVGTALSATSIGVAISMWKSSHKLKTKVGQIFLDLAAIDDILGIVFLTLILGIAPALQAKDGGSLVHLMESASVGLVLRLMGFVLFCILFSKYVEPHLMRARHSAHQWPSSMITFVSSSLAIAGLAGLLGFSEAIGAFFAGLAFSRDPEAIKAEASFKLFENLFAPFFFLGIGYSISATALSEISFLVLIFFSVAFAGKFVGTFLPAYFSRLGYMASTVLALSMVPRAEIALVVLKKGVHLGDWAMPESLYASLVLAALGTCLITYLLVPPLLKRYQFSPE